MVREVTRGLEERLHVGSCHECGEFATIGRKNEGFPKKINSRRDEAVPSFRAKSFTFLFVRTLIAIHIDVGQDNSVYSIQHQYLMVGNLTVTD